MIAWALAVGAKRAFSPMEMGIKNQIFLEKTEVGILNSD